MNERNISEEAFCTIQKLSPDMEANTAQCLLMAEQIIQLDLIRQSLQRIEAALSPTPTSSAPSPPDRDRLKKALEAIERGTTSVLLTAKLRGEPIDHDVVDQIRKDAIAALTTSPVPSPNRQGEA